MPAPFLHRWCRTIFRLPLFFGLLLPLTVIGAAPLVATGRWTPPAGLVLLLITAALSWAGVRAVPRDEALGNLGWVLIALAALGGLWAGYTHSEHVVLRRDAGSYAQFSQQLATGHSARVDVRLADLGGSAAGIDEATGPDADRPVTVGSPGFYAQRRGADLSAIPQFFLGTPVWLSLFWWLGGWSLSLLLPAGIFAIGLLGFARLAVNFLGMWPAILATTLLTACLPMLHTARSTYSEPFAFLLGVVSLTLLYQAKGRPEEASSGAIAVLAGFCCGSSFLFRVDGLREIALLFPVLAFLAVTRPRVVARVLLGLVVSLGAAAIIALGLSRPYLAAIADSVLPLLALALAAAAGSFLLYLAARYGWPRVRRPSARVGAWLAPLGAALGLSSGLALAVRPLWQVARPRDDDPIIPLVASWQQLQGLPVDGRRNYAEQSLNWVSWWLGWPAVVFAVVTLAGLCWYLGRQLGLGRSVPAWSGPLFIAYGSTMLTLIRPAITPDHPWADRRLVPFVFPTMVLLSVVGLRHAVVQAARRWPQTPRVPQLFAVIGTALLLLPVIWATAPLAGQRTERGGLAAIERSCSGFAPDESAIMIDNRAANEWTQVLRGMCSVPTVVVRDDRQLPRVVAAIRAVGRSPVLVAGDSAQSLSAWGVTPKLLVNQRSTDHQRRLAERPSGSVSLRYLLWRASAPRVFPTSVTGPVPSGST